MSTTVIASAYGAGLIFAPWLRREVDRAALSEVLARYGLELLPGTTTATEFIAAQGLSHSKAARLAEELRAIGLSVRVVNKTGLTTSEPVSMIQAGHLAVGLLATMFAFALQKKFGVDALALLPVGMYALLGFASLAGRGGARLAVAGVEPEAHEDGAVALLVEEIRALREELPDHLVTPLLARAERLGAEGSESAAELSALASEVRADRDQRAAAEIRAIRDEVRKARRAAGELRR